MSIDYDESLDSPAFVFLAKVVEKMETLSYSPHVRLTTDEDITNLSDDDGDPDTDLAYPYIEVEKGIFGTESYDGTCHLDGTISIMLKLVMKQSFDEDTGLPLAAPNYRTIINALDELLVKVFSFNDDKELGQTPCKGFQHINPNVSAFSNPAIDDGLMLAGCVFSAQILKII